MANIVILGAGLTGLSTAYHLEQNGCFDYALFEQDTTTGGLCRTVSKDGFTFDYTGHLLHINDDYFRTFIERVVGFENFNTITRRSFVYSEKTYTPYPYQVNLHGLPLETIVACIEGYVARKKRSTSPKNFRDWVLTHFGAGFGKHFFYPYQEKIFDYPIEKLSASWTGRFVPQTSLAQLLSGALSEPREQIGYNAQFFYPKQGGTAFWVNKLAEQLLNPIHTQHRAVKIDARKQIVYFENGHQEPYEQLVTTLPLDCMLDLLVEPTTLTVKSARNKLLCTSVHNFNLGIRGNISDKHWIYFPEKQFPMYRIGFSHNLAHSMAPENHSLIYGEVGFLNKDASFRHERTEEAVAKTCALLNINPEDIKLRHDIFIKHAYVVFNAWRDAHLPTILTRLTEHAIHSIGRYGAWKYSSMQEGLLDGKYTAEQVITPHRNKSLQGIHAAL